MSNILEEYRKRNDLIREFKNKYKLGMHPHLKNPDGVMVHYPKGMVPEGSSESEHVSEDSKSLENVSETAKSDIAEKVETMSMYIEPFLDDEDWISSDEDDDIMLSTEESKRLATFESTSKSQNTESEDAKMQSDTSKDKTAGDEDDNNSDMDEELKEVSPEKVNWLKYIFKKYVKDSDPDYSVLTGAAVMEPVLGVLLSPNTDEMIQGDLMDLIGSERFDMLMELIEKRQYIQNYCRSLSSEISKEKRGQKTGPNPHNIQIGVTVTFGDKRKNKKGKGNRNVASGPVTNHDLLSKLGFGDDYINENRMLGLKEANRGDLLLRAYENPYANKRKAREFRGDGVTGKAKYTSQHFDEPDWTEVHLIPPERKKTQPSDLIKISDLMEWMQPAFQGTDTLNTIQSIVFDAAFNSINNVLVAAPTGAGKTNIALLTIMREVRQFIPDDAKTFDMTEKKMKIVYLAPLKALASEIVAKFTKALAYLKIKVREFTGDMNLTKVELAETHVIVSTPEKWDVVTRKADGLMNEVNLMIIDEIHLLNDERGTVLECLVARALTTLIRNQKMIRILGLSATLPNYMDVADFIQAPEESTFYFDPSYRPTPLRCRFYGVKDYGSIKRCENVMNEITFSNIVRCLKMGKQVLVFVHKRNATYSTAQDLIKILQENKQHKEHFECMSRYKINKEVERCGNKYIKELFMCGFGIHHAGMQRKDRNLSEKLFEQGHIKVLCTTATLAWGINLPAYCTIIKGTQIYDANLGQFKDIGIFDVQQIFGRAGRPQYDVEGEGIICTTANKVDDYVQMMSNEKDIESHLHMKLDDCLNAEIAIGTVTNISEAIQWIKFTYLWIRLKRNPRFYGVDTKLLIEDPNMNMFLFDLVATSCNRLNSYKMIKYHKNTDQVSTTSLGRIGSAYYVGVKTMSYFEKSITRDTPEEKLLFFMAKSSEFDQIRGRPEEESELVKLYKECHYIDVDKDEILENYGKTLILLECYLKGVKTDIADLSYIIQNSARIMRALFDFCLKKNYNKLTIECLKWCKLIDKRMLPDQHPLRQFTALSIVGKLTNPGDRNNTQGLMPFHIAQDLERDKITLDAIIRGQEREFIEYSIGTSFSDILYNYVRHMPNLQLEVTTKTLTRSILEIHLTIYPQFVWSSRWNGKSEPFWVIISNGDEIYSSTTIDLGQLSKDSTGKKGMSSTFFVPYEIGKDEDEVSASLYYEINVISDRWVGVEFYETIYLADIEIPEKDYPHTKLLPLKPLPLTALNNPTFEKLYSNKFEFFNPVQTQVFYNLYHTDMNILIGAPTSSGKTIMSELAILRVFKERPDGKIIYIAPMKALAKERLIDWKRRFQEGDLKKSVVELTGDVTPDLEALQKSSLVITTPEKWDGISRNWQHRDYVRQVALVIIDEIHLLGQERGPVIEVIVSRFRYITAQTRMKVRIVGLSTALANAKDVGDWLGISKFGLYNFKPSVRPVPVEVYIEGFPEKHYCPRMATMNKPTYKAIMTHSRDHPTLVFVSSRRQTRLTALDLIALISGEQLTGDYQGRRNNMSPEELQAVHEQIDDENLRNTVNFGIGMHHAGLTENDRKIVEHLFVSKKILILVTTSTLAWGVNFPARLVVIKGTEYYDAKIKRYVDIPVSDILQMMGRAGRPQFDNKGIACIFVTEEKKNFYKKFLYEPFPVESSLHTQLVEHLNAEIAAGTLQSLDNCIDYMTWTYFFRRLVKNPSFYNMDKNKGVTVLNDFLKELILECISKLEKSKCVEFNKEDGSLVSTSFGYLCSYYYIFHETIAKLQKEIQEHMNSQALFLPILTNNKEFNGLPVRHNEDILNEALSLLVPVKVPGNKLDSPNVKSNLLIQAHLTRAPMPITDYITDTKMVLDQTIRVVQCMIDVAAHKGFLDTSLNLIGFQQMIMQGTWQHKTVFKNIPYFNDKIIYKLSQLGIYHLCQLLPYVPNLTKFFKNTLQVNLSMDEMKEIYSALIRVPLVKMKYNLQTVNSMGDPAPGPLIPGTEAIMTVNLERVNHKTSRNVIIKSFPKPKDCGWFIVVGNPSTNELIALKRTPLSRTAKRELQVPLPSDFKSESIKLYLMSDCYIGIDQVIEIDLRKVNHILTKIEQGEIVNSNLNHQFELIQNLKDISSDESDDESERVHNELSDSDYDSDEQSYASDVSDDPIEKNVDCWI